ncbi:peptide chain release factor N(5)-glutamine methyltransferase [Sphingorhabdus arenilitoris]|uniref:Release factor glutamine methyltransferase n=1 Tax=Sphingorhabdus arenilitoris TaxID=1490041 RepID=A0ABV8RHW3_9SPHN
MITEKTIISRLAEAATDLSLVSDTARLDAEILLAHALGMDRNEMLMRHQDLRVPASFEAMLARRVAHEPVAYITGVQHFWDLTLCVTSDVLIPRSDSETLIDAAEKYFAGTQHPAEILDLGTGSGALILAALSLFPRARGTAIDASAAALAIASQNADHTGFANRLHLSCLSWHEDGWTQQLGGRFDLILCNPPYVENDADLSPMVRDYEPASALFAGDDGLHDYRVIIPQIAGILAPDGAAIFEIGAAQAQSVSEIAQAAGFKAVLTHDLAGNPRALTLTRAG